MGNINNTKTQAIFLFKSSSQAHKKITCRFYKANWDREELQWRWNNVTLNMNKMNKTNVGWVGYLMVVVAVAAVVLCLLLIRNNYNAIRKWIWRVAYLAELWNKCKISPVFSKPKTYSWDTKMICSAIWSQNLNKNVSHWKHNIRN